MNQVSTIITRAREVKGNKSQVARKLGISSQLLGQYESGSRVPKTHFFLKWKDVFKEDLLKQIEANVSHGTDINDQMSTEGFSPTLAVILKIAEGNKVLYDANRDLAAANLILAENNKELVAMIKGVEKRGPRHAKDGEARDVEKGSDVIKEANT